MSFFIFLYFNLNEQMNIHTLLLSVDIGYLYREGHKRVKTESSEPILPIQMSSKPKEQSRVNNEILTCQKCTFRATRSSSIKLHQIVHADKRPYICSECGYETSNAGNFNNHIILIHYNDKPFSCHTVILLLQ